MATRNPVINELQLLLSIKKAELHSFEETHKTKLAALEEEAAMIEKTIEMYVQGTSQ